MTKRFGRIGLTLGSTVVAAGISAAIGFQVFAATPPSFSPVPSDVHYVIKTLSPSTTSMIGGNYISVTVTVYQVNGDLTSNGQPESTYKTLPLTLPFTFTSPTGDTISEQGVMEDGSSGKVVQTPTLTWQHENPGTTWTASYRVMTPTVDASTAGTWTFWTGNYTLPPNLTDSEIEKAGTYTPTMLMTDTPSSANTYLNYDNSTGQYVPNEWLDGDAVIWGKSGSINLQPPLPPGNLPEVPYAGVLPAVGLAGALALWYRRRRHTN